MIGLVIALRARTRHIGHTRWATHGRPSEENAHPHTDCTGTLVVVHNGILENYLEIEERLRAEGHTFRSETDTEVLAHLIEHHLRHTGRLDRAVKRALAEFRGSYAIAVVSTAAPDRVIAAKHGGGSDVIGLGCGEMFVASDIPAILSHTRDVVVLDDDEVAVVTSRGVEVSTLDDQPVQREPVRILWDPIMAEKGGYRHFMLKEIYEQPQTLRDSMRGRLCRERHGDLRRLCCRAHPRSTTRPGRRSTRASRPQATTAPMVTRTPVTAR